MPVFARYWLHFNLRPGRDNRPGMMLFLMYQVNIPQTAAVARHLLFEIDRPHCSSQNTSGHFTVTTTRLSPVPGQDCLAH